MNVNAEGLDLGLATSCMSLATCIVTACVPANLCVHVVISNPVVSGLIYVTGHLIGVMLQAVLHTCRKYIVFLTCLALLHCWYVHSSLSIHAYIGLNFTKYCKRIHKNQLYTLIIGRVGMCHDVYCIVVMCINCAHI